MKMSQLQLEVRKLKVIFIYLNVVGTLENKKMSSLINLI